MHCQKCGMYNRHIVYKPVVPSSVRPYTDGEKPVMETFYKRWACTRCGRYHFADGTLYHNPFKETA